MDVKKYAEQYGISEAFFQQIIEEGILEEHASDLGKDKVEQGLSSCICLHALGLDLPTIKNYVQLEQSKQDAIQARINILAKARKEMLTHMHNAKDTVDCIERIMIDLNRME